MDSLVYLEKHPPFKSQFRVKRRSKVSGSIVIHTAENNTDLVLPDQGAEGVAAFISRRGTYGSYHSVVDSDSICRVGKYEWEMFHEGTGGNRWSLGLSFACRADQWPTLPDEWKLPALRNGAIEAVNMMDWVKSTTGIEVPIQLIDAEEYHDFKPGFLGHGDLDPRRRSDPGKNFPWWSFFEFVHEIIDIRNNNMDESHMDNKDSDPLFWIDWSYRFFLGRTPSKGELDYWIITHNEGTSIHNITSLIADSLEAKQNGK